VSPDEIHKVLSNEYPGLPEFRGRNAAGFRAAPQLLGMELQHFGSVDER
jgi:hypothetical protein